MSRDIVSKNLIVIYIDNIERFYFFNRFVPALIVLGYKVALLTLNLSVLLLARYYGLFCYTAFSKLDVKVSIALSEAMSSSEVVAGYYGCSELKRIRRRILCAYGKIDSASVFAVWMWNGTNTSCRYLAGLAKQDGCKTLYFEIANIPGKLFVDCSGVNYESSISGELGLLDKYLGVLDFDGWRKEYVNNKIHNHVVSQSNKKSRAFSYAVDLFGYYILDLPDLHNVRVRRSFVMMGEGVSRPMCCVDEIPPRYVFFPLQVSDDSQLLINSDSRLLEHLKSAIQIAKQEKCPLVVKQHPAERNKKITAEIIALCTKENVVVSSLNTFFLISQAGLVVTVNSTCGMEAMLMDKKVKFLGRSIFDGMSMSHLNQYIHGYLLDIDYFSRDEIVVSDVEMVLLRLGHSDFMNSHV